MKNTFYQLLKVFESDLNDILNNQLIDIILYGSTITGDFVEGRGDIDFIVFIKGNIALEQELNIYKLHEKYRSQNDLFRQLEGTFYSLNENMEIDGGVYVGTSRKGWKRIDGLIHGDLEQGMILQDYETINSLIDLNNHFKCNWKLIVDEIRKTTKVFHQLGKELGDIEFNIYAIQTTARNIYTLKFKGFTSKTKALELLYANQNVIKHIPYIEELKSFRYPYTSEELKLFSLNETEKILFTLLNEIDI